MKKALVIWIGVPFLFIAGMVGGPLIYIFTLTEPSKQYGQISSALYRMLLSFPGAFGVLIVGLVLLAMDIHAFERRRSYIEESIYPQ